MIRAHIVEPLVVEPQLIVTRSTIVCPWCGTGRAAVMPTDASRLTYECTGCGAMLRPRPGDCCVFCSHGSVPCPRTQAESGCCESGHP